MIAKNMRFARSTRERSSTLARVKLRKTFKNSTSVDPTKIVSSLAISEQFAKKKEERKSVLLLNNAGQCVLRGNYVDLTTSVKLPNIVSQAKCAKPRKSAEFLLQADLPLVNPRHRNLTNVGGARTANFWEARTPCARRRQV